MFTIAEAQIGAQHLILLIVQIELGNGINLYILPVDKITFERKQLGNLGEVALAKTLACGSGFRSGTMGEWRAPASCRVGRYGRPSRSRRITGNRFHLFFEGDEWPILFVSGLQNEFVLIALQVNFYMYRTG